MYTDLESWVKTIIALTWDMFFLNETIIYDWDILQNIISSLVQFQHKPTLSHVKGYQDSKVSYTQLSLPAKLKFNTDHLTSRYRALPNLQFNIIPAITGCNAYVSIMGNTITSNFLSELRQAASLAALKKYLSGKYSWPGLIYTNIDWTAHYMSIKKSSMPNKCIIKFIHGWLPIRNMTHRYHTKYDTKCPSCSHGTEDINHFLWCPTCHEWKTSLFTILSQYFSHTSTPPALADLLQECLHQWLPTDSPAFRNPSPQHTKLLTQQAQIRWDQLFHGWFSKQWSTIQHDYISQFRTPPNGYSSQTWL